METKYDELLAKYLGFDIFSNGCVQYEAEIHNSLPEFYNSWDWLIKIIEKIETEFDNDFTVEISSNTCSITGFELFPYFQIFNTGSDKRDAVYYACSQFVIWYNRHKIENP